MALTGMYRAAFDELAGWVEVVDPEAPVPALPGWTVADTYRHVAGVCADVLDDRLDGAPGAQWTDRQVRERRHLGIGEVVLAWRERLPALLERMAVDRRLSRMALDCWHHRHDVATAAGLPADRSASAEALAVQARALGRRWPADLPAVALVAGGVSAVAGPLEAVAEVTVEGPVFELARATIGRRSAAQWRAWRWSAAPEPFLEHLSVFPPPLVDLVE